MGIFGVFLILGGLFLGAIGGAASQAGVEGAGAAGGFAQIVGILNALIGIGYFVVIYGLWNLRDWGWIVAVALLGLGALVGLLGLIQGGGAGSLIGILINGGLIAYLWTTLPMYTAHRFLPIDPPQQPQQAR
jgi:hypothetical protein